MTAIEILRKSLTVSNQTIFSLIGKEGTWLIKSLLICNTTDSIKKVYLFYKNKTDAGTNIGAIFFGLDVEANETVQVPDRYIKGGDFIQAYSDANDSLVITADILKQ